MITEVLLTACFYFICIKLIFRCKFFVLENIPLKIIILLFTIKALAGILSGYFSSHIFSGDDSWFYFEMGKRMNQFAFENLGQYFMLMIGIVDESNANSYLHLLNWKNLPRFYDSETMIKVNSLLHFISFGKYSVHSLLFSFISFCGLVGFYKFFCSAINFSNRILFFALVLIPSLLLFSSGIIKESLLIGIAGIFIYRLHVFITQKRTPLNFIVTLLLFAFLFFIKPYFIFLLAPLLTAFYVNKFYSKGNKTILVFYCSALILFFSALLMYDKLYSPTPIPYSFALKQQSAMKNAIFMQSKTFSKPPVIASSWKSIFSNSHRAFFHSMFHPSFSSHNSLLRNVAAAETYFIFVLFLFSISKINYSNPPVFNFFVLCIAFVFLFYALVGFTSATEGTIVRFKSPALPFILALFFISRTARKT